MNHPKAPLVVRRWIDSPPQWVDVQRTSVVNVPGKQSDGLDAGEADAIALAIKIRADVLLMDDEEGVIAAREKGLEVIGTLGILSRAAQSRILDLADAFDRLKRTNFRYRPELMDQFLTGLR